MTKKVVFSKEQRNREKIRQGARRNPRYPVVHETLTNPYVTLTYCPNCKEEKLFTDNECSQCGFDKPVILPPEKLTYSE